MNLCKRALLFYRLAATQMNLPFKEKDVATTDPDKIEYDFLTANLPSISIENIINGINKFSTKEYFDLTPFSQELPKKVMRSMNSTTMILEYLKRALKCENDIKQKIIEDVSEFYLDNLEDFPINEYLNVFEKYDLPERILRKAQHKIIQSIITMQKDDNDNNVRQSMILLHKLIEKSTKFDKSFLYQLAKHFGPDYYGELIHLPSGILHGTIKPLLTPDFSKKKSINVYDVSEWLWAYRDSWQVWNKNDFIELINKSNNEAKQYLRSFLYAYGSGPVNYFILSEDMKPMNAEYQTISFPEQFYILYGWQDIDPIREVWQPIFDEFNIIPHTI